MNYIIHRYKSTASTNIDAAGAKPGEVFVAENQTAGRGRLQHKWHSRPGENLMMSVVFDVDGLNPEWVATFPLVVGLAVQRVVGGKLKWPNDLLVNGRKLAGVLCERHGNRVVAGIGVNVRQKLFPVELADKATSLALEGEEIAVATVLDRVLNNLSVCYHRWQKAGLAPFLDELAAVDYLKDKTISVMRTDDDPLPITGKCKGIDVDGALIVGDERIYAGEAHVMAPGE